MSCRVGRNVHNLIPRLCLLIRKISKWRKIPITSLLFILLVQCIFLNSATAVETANATIQSSGTISYSSPTPSERIMGAMDFNWASFNLSNVAVMKASGANTMKAFLFIDWWKSNIVSNLDWTTHYQAKYAQIVQWAHANGMKFWLECFSFDWAPTEGWDQMKANVIMNSSGLEDQWINGFGQIIQTLQPDIIGVMNEPGNFSTDTTYAANTTSAQFNQAYERFVIHAIDTWSAIDSHAKFSVEAIPFWDFTWMAANPIPRPNVMYEAHFYYSFDGSYPPSYATDQIAYWNSHLSTAKSLLQTDFLNTMNLQAMFNKNLTVNFGECGTCDANPNALVFMQDLFDFAKAHNMGVIQEIFRIYGPDFPTGMLNLDGVTLNTLGQLWAANMQT